MSLRVARRPCVAWGRPRTLGPDTPPMAEPEPAAARAAPPPARTPVALATLALLVAAGSVPVIVRATMIMRRLEAEMHALQASRSDVDQQSARLTRSVDLLGNAVTTLSDEQVDLLDGKLQHLRHGFAVSELRTERQDTGVRVAGRMINTSSLRYKSATFRLRAGGSSAELTIDMLAPGGSGDFDVV